MLQYPHNFGTVRTNNGIWFIIILFIFLSHLSVSLFGAKVGLFEEARVANGFEAEELRGVSGVEVAESVGEDGGFGVWVNLDYEGFGLGSGCG